MNTNGNGKELEYKIRLEESKADIIGIIETKLSKNVKSQWFSQKYIR